MVNGKYYSSILEVKGRSTINSRALLFTIIFSLCSTVAAQQIEEDVDSYSKMLRELVSSTKKRDYESPLKSIGDWLSKYNNSPIKNYVEGHQTIITDVNTNQVTFWGAILRLRLDGESL